MNAERKRVKRWLRERYGEPKRQRSEPKPSRKLPWKLIIVALVAVVVVAAVVWLRPWEGKPAGEEYVWVQYLASFKLLSTSDNGPIENLVSYWPYPYTTPEKWEVANLTEGESPAEVVLYLQRENLTVPYLLGISSENRGDILFASKYENWVGEQYWFLFDLPVENSKFTVPSLSINLIQGKLYPGDEFQIEAWFKISVENVAKLTLVNWFAENCAGIAFDQWIPETTIGIEVSVELTKYQNGESQVLKKWARQITEGVPQMVSVRLFKS